MAVKIQTTQPHRWGQKVQFEGIGEVQFDGLGQAEVEDSLELQALVKERTNSLVVLTEEEAASTGPLTLEQATEKLSKMGVPMLQKVLSDAQVPEASWKHMRSKKELIDFALDTVFRPAIEEADAAQ